MCQWVCIRMWHVSACGYASDVGMCPSLYAFVCGMCLKNLYVHLYLQAVAVDV